MRSLFKMGTARGLQGLAVGLGGFLALYYLAWNATRRFQGSSEPKLGYFQQSTPLQSLEPC